MEGIANRKTRNPRSLLLLAAMLGTIPGAKGATPIALDGTAPYTQDFNTLPTSSIATLGGSSPFNVPTTAGANSPLLGWQFAVPSGTSNQFRADNGGASSGAVYSYGQAGSTERALGSLGSGTFNLNTFGAIFTNTSQQTFTSFTLSYTGEQWRRGNETGEALVFSYGLGASSIISGTFTVATELDFTSPSTAIGINGLNGNDPANQKAISATITGISWAPGAALVIRWRDSYGGSVDDGLAIDGLSFSAAGSTVKNLVWSPSTNIWDTTSPNWRDGGTTTTFGSGDQVTFGDTAVGAVNIDPAGVSPGGVTVSNTFGTYTFTGGPIKGAGGLTKTGLGTLVLASSNAYTGTTTLNGGTLILGAVDVLPDKSALHLQAGTLDIGANNETVGTVTMSGGTILGIGTLTGSAYTVSGGNINAPLGGALANLTKVGADVVVLGARNTYGGLTTIADGALRLAGGPDTLSPGSVVTMGSGQLDLNGNDQHLAGLTGQGSIINSAGGIATLTLSPEDDEVFDGDFQGAVKLVKAGGGSLTLTGASTHNGGTVVNAGSLWMSNNIGSATGFGEVSVGPVGRIGGTGSIAGLVKVDGAVAPGDEGVAGVLHLGSLELHQGSHLQFDLNANTAASDLILVSGLLSLPATNGSVFLDITDLGSLQTGTYTLISPGQGLTGALASLAIGSAPGKFRYAFSNDGGGLSLLVTPLPGAKVWSGAASGNWDKATANWTGGTGLFVDGDGVTFNGLAAGNTTITVVGTVSPGSMVFNNSLLNYTISGGVIAGSGGLGKDGTGVVTLLGDNLFSGDVVINRGTLAVAGFGSLGTGSTPIAVGSAANAATLRIVGGVNTATARGISVGNAGANIDVQNAAVTATIDGPMTGSGPVTKTGSGVLLLTGGSPIGTVYGGAWEVDAGTLQLGPGIVGGTGEPLNALGYVASDPSEANAVVVVGGILAGAVNAPNPLAPGAPALPYFRSPITLAGGALATAMLADADGARFGGNLTILGNTSRILLYDPASLVTARNVSVVASGNTNWNGTLTIDPGLGIGGALNLGRMGGMVSVGVGGKLMILPGATVNLGGADVLTDSADPSRHLDVNNDGVFNISTSQQAGNMTGNGNLAITGAGTVLSAGVLRQNALIVGDGAKVSVRDGLGDKAGHVAVLNALTILGSGQVDLTDNDLVVHYSGINPEPQLQAYVRDWFVIKSGPMLMASRFDDGSSPFLRTLAVADNAELKFPSFDGQFFAPGDVAQVLVKYTYLGDANLDGRVTPKDYAIVDGNISPGTDWGRGDLNGDGKTTPADYAQIDGNIGAGTGANGGPQLSTADGSWQGQAVTAVPEPGGFLAAAAGIVVAARRRRSIQPSDTRKSSSSTTSLTDGAL